MSLPSPIHQRVLEEFGRALGPPTPATGHGHQWTFIGKQGRAPIFVLVNGGSDHATVWVVDPNDQVGGVCSEVITRAESIPRLLGLIRGRVDGGRAAFDGDGSMST